MRELNAALEIVARELVLLFDARNSGIALLNPARTELTIVASYSREADQRTTVGIVIPLAGNPSSVQVVETRRSIVVPHAQTSPLTGPIHDLMRARRTECLMIVPLLARGDVIGTIGVATGHPDRVFTQAEVALAETIAGQIAGSVENARLFDTERTAREQAETLRAATQALSTTLDLQKVFELILTELQKVVPYDSSSVLQVKGDRLVIIGGRGFTNLDEIRGLSFGLSDESTPSTEVLRRRAPYILEDAPTVYRGFLAEPHTRAQIRSWMGVPLLFGDRVIGMFTLDKHQLGFYTEAHARLALAFGAQAAIALENARLFEETRQRMAEVSTINSVAQAITSQLDLHGIIELVGDKLRDIFAAQYIYVALLDPRTDLIHFPYYWDNGRRIVTDEAYKLGVGLTSRVIQSGRPLVINEDWERQARDLGAAALTGELPKSSLTVPIMAGEAAIGVISVQSTEHEHFFSESAVRLLTTIAGQVGVAIENARLFESERQRAAELETVNRIGQALSSQLDVDTLIDLIGETVRKTFNAQLAYVAVHDPKAQLIHFPYYYENGESMISEPLPFGQGLASRIIASRQPLLITDNVEQSLSELGVENFGTLAQSYLGVPILVGDPSAGPGQSAMGVISVQNTERTDAFGEADVRLLTTIAANVAVAMQNAQLYQETQRRASEMAALAEIGRNISATLDQQAVLEGIARFAFELFKAQSVYMRLVEPDDQTLRTVVALGAYVTQALQSTLRLGEGITGSIAQSGIAEVINDPRHDPRTVTMPGTPEEEEEPESMMIAPLIFRDVVIGVMTVYRVGPERFFGQSDLDFLVGLTRQASIAIQNARLFQETTRLLEESRQRATELATINSISQALASQLELATLIDLVGDKMRETFNAQIVYIALLDLPTNTIHFPYQYGQHLEPLVLGQGITSKVIELNRPLLLNQEPDYEQLHVARVGTRSKSYLGVPIVAGDEVIGVISVQSTEREHRFGQADARLLTTIAASVGAAIERARLYASAQQQREYFESLVLNNPVAIVTSDLSWKIVSWNPAAERLFGYTRAEAVGGNIDDLIAPPDRQAEAIEYTHKAYREDRVQAITQRKRKDGTLVDVELLALPVRVAGRQVGAIAIYHDITELQRARQEAEAANQAKGDFLANVSHELRTPLTSVLGFAKIIKKRLEEIIFPSIAADERRLSRAMQQVSDNLSIILAEGERLTSLINNVLDLAKIEAGKIVWQQQPVSMAEVVERAVAATSSLVEQKGLRLAKEIAPDLPEIVGDRDRLIQVVINLVSNAVKFTERGGRITCRAVSASGELVVSVSDTGIGIAAEDVPMVFDKFVQVGDTLTDKPQGTGLGLPICKQIVEHHGGHIWVESRPGHGSTFAFSLPAAEAG